MAASEYPAAAEARAGWQRRRVAALRLPPMACGHRDPLDPAHLRGDCPWRRRRAA